MLPVRMRAINALAFAIGLAGHGDAWAQSSPPTPATLPAEAGAISAGPVTAPTMADYHRALAAVERAAQAATRAAGAAEAAARDLRLIASGMTADASSVTSGAVGKVVPGADAPVVTGANAQGKRSTIGNMIVDHIADNRLLAVEAVESGSANGPNDRFLKSSPTPDLQFIASSEDKIASLSWTLDISGVQTGKRLAADHLTITAASDLDSSHEAKILGLDGFSGGTEIALSYIHYSTEADLNGTEKPEVERARESCLNANGDKDDVAQLCDPYSFPTGVSMFVLRYYPQGLRSMIKAALPGNVDFYGVRVAASQIDFTYLDRAAFTTRDQSRLGFKATAFGGVLLGLGQSALTGSFTYGRRYAENDPVTLCQPITTPQTQCLTNADGAPVRKDKAIVAVEARHGFGAAVGQFATLAIAPQVSVDLKSKAFSLDVPVYFVGDGTGKLRGGVRGVYLNRRDGTGGREDDFTLGLFVGVPFSVFGS